jgi:hypothetical protein
MIGRLGFRVGADDRIEQSFLRFVDRLHNNGYRIQPLAPARPSFALRHAHLRYDVFARTVDIDAAMRLAALHERLRLPGTFHIAWDLIEEHPRLRKAVLPLAEFDPRWVHLGLHCDPLSHGVAGERFGGSLVALARFAGSARFVPWLEELLSAWRRQAGAAPALHSLHELGWAALVALDASFRRAVGRSSSLSGRKSELSVAFAKARAGYSELRAISPWVEPLDFLSGAPLPSLGYPFEATRFGADLRPGPTVLHGNAELSRLRSSLAARVAGGGGFVAIFPARDWSGERYEGLLSELSEPSGSAAAAAAPAVGSPRRRAASVARRPPAAPLDRPVLTGPGDLIGFGRNCERVDARQLATAAREKVGDGVDDSFPRFVSCLRGEGYSFGSFESGPPRFAERFVYLRYDVHLQDLLAAYVLADLHQRLAVVGSFQITWQFSRFDEAIAPYFAKLLEFDRRFVQFGLHAAPTASWYLNEKLGGDGSTPREAVESDDFVAWLLELRAAFRRDRHRAAGLREIRQGTDDTLSAIAASFRQTFGAWKSISGHGNFLTAGFDRAAARYPQLKVLRPYFAPVAYLSRFGVARFGFELEATAFGRDEVRFPRLITESPGVETRRRSLRGRIANGAGFVVLLHPASWTWNRNASFFLPGEIAAEARSEPVQGRP